jgi:hypothetical protein
MNLQVRLVADLIMVVFAGASTPVNPRVADASPLPKPVQWPRPARLSA